uniref:Putative secreted protein n=1 Tax=Ixodes ricinus TaxID=34613 RepID=A0A6B0U0W0_IXORI
MAFLFLFFLRFPTTVSRSVRLHLRIFVHAEALERTIYSIITTLVSNLKTKCGMYTTGRIILRTRVLTARFTHATHNST